MLGVLPGLIGVIQATETVKILLGKGTTLSGRLLLYDALHMQFRELTLRRDPKATPITELIDYAEFCGVPTLARPPAEEPFGRIDVLTFKARWDDGWRPYVLDVRKPHEADIAALSFADRLQPHEVVAEIADELPRDRDIVVHCKLGGRSVTAARTLAALGFARIVNLEGGIVAWAEQVDPSLPTY